MLSRARNGHSTPDKQKGLEHEPWLGPVAIELTLHVGGGLVSIAMVATLIALDGLDEWRFRVG